jgi:signal transduction histidine kinase
MKRSTATGKHTATYKVKKIKKKNSTTPVKNKVPIKSKVTSTASSEKKTALKNSVVKQDKKLEAVILNVYNEGWEAYMRGDLKAHAACLSNDFKIIGTTEAEHFNTKKAWLAFCKKTIHQVVGVAQMRNRKIKLEAVGDGVMVIENSDIYVLIEGKWRFYSKLRVTALMRKEKSGWKYVHQHGSLPDTRASENETIATEKIKKENQQLREAVKRRTIELEEKNRELEIESSLERVRAQALGMSKSEDLLDICRTLYRELITLGITTLRNAVIHVFHDERECFTDHEYSDNTGGNITTVPFKGDVTIEKFIKQIRKSENAFVELKVEGKELSNWKLFRKKTGQIKDNRLKQIKVIHYYIYSVGHASIGISSFNAIEKDKKELLKRFRNVFDFAYRRYTDIAQAQAQARESQIQLALERVRARTMAMHKTAELQSVIHTVHQELLNLNISISGGSFIVINSEIDNELHCWGSGGTADTSDEVHIPYFDKPFYTHLLKGIKSGHGFFTEEYTREEKIEFFTFLFQHKPWSKLGAKEKKVTLSAPGGYTRSCAVAKHTSIFIINHFGERFSEAENAILKRFGKVFEQSYTRFLDLQKAEAQAREAQIEAALERVRSRSMAMHKSEELPEVIQLVFEQLRQLNFNIDSAQFDLNFRESDDINLWTAVPGQPYPTQQHIPYFNNAVFNSVKHAKEAGLSLSVHNFTFEEKNEFFNYFFKYTSIPEERRKFILSLPGWARSVVYLDRIYLGIQNYSGIPYLDTEHAILGRFAKVFEQAYTRFLDLQKAEAQAREAQIETALEKVRSRSLAMHTSSELNEVVKVLFEKLTELQVPSTAVGIQTFIEGSNDMQAFVCGDVGTGIVINQYRLPYFDHPIVHDYLNAHKNKLEVFVGNYSKNEKDSFYDVIIKLPELKDLAAEVKTMIYNSDFYEVTIVPAEKSLIAVNDFQGNPLAESQVNILKRFAKVFDQTYTRFLDLQKAEAQAREAQIEAAVERVRAKAMAMHHPDDLDLVNKELLNQLHQLQLPGLTGVTFYLINEYGWVNAWDFSSPGNIGSPNSYMLQFDFTKYEMMGDPFRVLLHSDHNYYVADYPLEKLKKAVYEIEEINPVVATVVKEALASGKLTHQWSACAKIANGILGVDLVNPPNEDTKTIILKMAGAFNQAYTRFIDLQKAEAQAREAEIQLALERVRAQTMAMHNSDDVGKCVIKMFSELTALGVDEGTRFGIGILNHENENNQLWTVRKNGDEVNLHIGNIDMASHPLLKSARQAWLKQVPFHKYVLDGEDLLNYYQMLNNAPDYKIQIPLEQLPEREIQHCFIFEHGFFYAFCPREFQPELIHITKRFTSQFAQTYTRYLDLIRAEAQAREAQIEAALERVRAASMAMHKSEELKKVASAVFRQLKELNIEMNTASILLLSEHNADLNVWIGMESDKDYSTTSIHVPEFDYYLFPEFNSEIKNRKHLITKSYTYEEKNKLWNYLFEYSDFKTIPDERKKFILDAESYTISVALLKNTGIQLIRYSSLPFSEKENETLQRFCKVFEQAYTRFLDLQKAEAQAREAQVETSLERVRSKTMAMHNSQEVGESVATLFDELLALGVLSVNDRCGIGIMQPDETMEAWTAAKTADGKAELTIGYLNMTAHPLLEAAYHGWAEKLEKHQYILEGEDILRYYNAIRNQADYKIKRDYFSDHAKIVHTDFYFNEGCLYVFSLNEFSSDSAKIFLRFAAVFGQTYRRYLDLQKAEAQAREAQIEAAMEKVRSRAMAMQKPNELVEVAKLLRKEMGMLGVEELETSSIYIHNHESGMTECWYAIKDEKNPENNLVSDHMLLDLNDTWVGKQMADFYHSNEKQTSIVMTGENRLQWINYCASHSKVLVGYYGDNIPDRTYHLYKFPGGYMGAASTGSISNESWDLLQRACSVFSLAYTRFKDLQQAEARAREAVKQAALDRVRADIASMRNTSDLDRIIPLIWKELTTLGIPFIRCGVFIMDELLQQIHTFLSTPDGKAIAAFHLPYDSQGRTREILTSWMSKQVYIEHWDEKAFSELGDLLVQQGAMPSKDVYMKTIPAGGLYLHCLPFMQGMLYVGNTIKLNEEEIQLIQSVAEAFATAYARYEDFNKLEAAKQQVDNALVELKQTQQQLVQSEKMASLGELTAGIAHEIQNPLNFVNNFSEVSNELIKEIQDIRHKTQDQGNKTEEDEILNDIASNLQKINHHGKRAADIVKGMLQHSRTSSGQKELTDINALADEYLRLAYHGLRAKDKSFNAKFETHLDPTLPKLNVIPQDIGRVLLNLINNAFYATSEKSSYAKASEDKYEPTVIVSTKNLGNKIEISVKDNGNGIPDSIKEKIFQPFFTTKPTGQGTGLGLSLSYDIVKAHGGELKVETTEGTGTTFTIILHS